jgi:pimeloyl-ACP methyl ester carboxylesterase
MGQMVLDARHAVDAVLANPDADPKRISLVGFGMGGMVATLTAALDERITSVVSASGFTPFRSDTDKSGTGGVRRWSHLYGWLPRLGKYVGNEAAIPIDFPEILAAIAPRPVLVVAPSLDWHHSQRTITRAVESSQGAFDRQHATNKLQLYRPVCLAEFNNDIQNRVTEFLLGL